MAVVGELEQEAGAWRDVVGQRVHVQPELEERVVLMRRRPADVEERRRAQRLGSLGRGVRIEQPFRQKHRSRAAAEWVVGEVAAVADRVGRLAERLDHRQHRVERLQLLATLDAEQQLGDRLEIERVLPHQHRDGENAARSRHHRRFQLRLGRDERRAGQPALRMAEKSDVRRIKLREGVGQPQELRAVGSALPGVVAARVRVDEVEVRGADAVLVGRGRRPTGRIARAVEDLVHREHRHPARGHVGPQPLAPERLVISASSMLVQNDGKRAGA